MSANLQPAGLTQAVAKRDVFLAAMQRHLGAEGLAEWEPPQAGMFFWFKLVIPGAEDSAQVVRTQAVARGVLALPGTVFLPDGRASAYVRAAFSLLSEQEPEVDEAMRRLRATILDASLPNFFHATRGVRGAALSGIYVAVAICGSNAFDSASSSPCLVLATPASAHQATANPRYPLRLCQRLLRTIPSPSHATPNTHV
ncbi:hypothetical protein GGX14DRAFT_575398 [Mycena pura]|uniref:Uncharacterized protein n=1 Tax=Mycena pura TaxID=153505 RepID=A0AAD6Y822_9AGAR|nr:hypothetical protein GGX14DRAFT_575398 [Mycena pura]